MNQSSKTLRAKVKARAGCAICGVLEEAHPTFEPVGHSFIARPDGPHSEAEKAVLRSADVCSGAKLPRRCTICHEPAWFVAQDATGLEWFECGSHGDRDNEGLVRVRLMSLTEWDALAPTYCTVCWHRIKFHTTMGCVVHGCRCERRWESRKAGDG